MITLFALIFVVPKAIYPLVAVKNKNLTIWIFAAISAFIIGEGLSFGIFQGLNFVFGYLNLPTVNFNSLLQFCLLGGFIGVEIIRRILLKSFENK